MFLFCAFLENALSTSNPDDAKGELCSKSSLNKGEILNQEDLQDKKRPQNTVNVTKSPQYQPEEYEQTLHGDIAKIHSWSICCGISTALTCAGGLSGCCFGSILGAITGYLQYKIESSINHDLMFRKKSKNS